MYIHISTKVDKFFADTVKRNERKQAPPPKAFIILS